MFRVTIFIIALLLLAGAVEPSKSWLIALAVLAGLELVRWRPLRGLRDWRRWNRSLDRRWSWEADW
jgi:hypothetical protein